MVLRNVSAIHCGRSSVVGIALRRRRPDGRPGLFRRDGPPDRDPVLDRRAPGRHGRVCRTALGGARGTSSRACPACSPWSRSVRARAHAIGHRERYLSITGVSPAPRFQPIVDRDGREVAVPPAGLVLSKVLAESWRSRPETPSRSRCSKAAVRRSRHRVTGAGRRCPGPAVFMDMSALHADARRRGRHRRAAADRPVSGGSAVARAQGSPIVAGATFKRTVAHTFRETMAANMNVTILLNVIFAAMIAFGVVYNAARVALSERSHELASLRVLGYTRARDFDDPVGELALLTLAALPVGWLFGYMLVTVHLAIGAERGLPLSAVCVGPVDGVGIAGNHGRDGCLGSPRRSAPGSVRFGRRSQGPRRMRDEKTRTVYRRRDRDCDDRGRRAVAGCDRG